jgi:SAM-dependent methyltransferase
MSSVADYTAIAASYGVSAEIHPSDHIFRFMREHPVVGPRAAAEYFSDGRDCAVKLRTLIEERRPVDSVSILEFASGYGRVSRHLPKVIPEATLTACDIHAEAVRFIDWLGVESILSRENPDDFNAGRAFDVVFALSFFSHIPQTTWTRRLRRLLDCTLPGGLLIFTTLDAQSRKFAAPESVSGDDFSFLLTPNNWICPRNNMERPFRHSPSSKGRLPLLLMQGWPNFRRDTGGHIKTFTCWRARWDPNPTPDGKSPEA